MKYLKYVNKLNLSLEGKTYIVTGANSGIGFEVSKYLAYLGASVVMACRNENKAQDALSKIIKEVPKASLTIVKYDQASLASINEFIEIVKRYHHIDGLICNAGVYFPRQGMKSEDGFDLTLGTNYIGQFHLVDGLLEKLKSDHSRIVIVNSLTAFMSKRRDLHQYNTISRNKQYGYSKLLLSQEAYELINKYSLEVVLTHPGICSTNILFNKDTGLSSAFARAGRRFLNIFTHPASKAALSLLVSATCDYQKYLYVKPRGLFAISGYPAKRKMPNKFYSDDIIEVTREIINQKENEHAISK